MESWTKEGEGWASSLCKHWRGPKPAIILPDRPADLPNVLCLGTDLDFPPPTGNRILVTRAYEDLFRRLLVIRERDVGSARGAVVTGQPGTGTSMNRPPPCATAHRWIRSPGKTTFLTLMLVRLVSAHQVVFYCNPNEIFLFYRGEVYTRSTQSGFKGLPRVPGVSYCPVWALINMDYEDKPPPITELSKIWPILASSPRPVRWKQWHKQNRAALLGMPLWSMWELMMGYVVALFPQAPRYQSRPCRAMSVCH